MRANMKLLLPLLFFACLNSYGQCPGFTNLRNPSAGTNVVVTGSTPWQFVQQVYVSDNVYSTRNTFPVTTTHYMYVYDWRFSTFSPSAIICGIKIRMERSADPGNATAITDLEMRLWDGSSYSPNNYADPNPWPTTDTYITYGGNGDLWGWGSISPAVINSVAFGMRFRAQSAIGANIAYIDHIQLTGYANEFLPVELLSFDALKDFENHAVHFKWKCASEINNHFFKLERSRDNEIWETVKTIEGGGNSSLVTNYETTDAEPFPGESYYRLSQTDYDGTTKILDMISVRFKNYLDEIMIYPSVASDIVNIKAKADINNSQVIISDISGAIVKQFVFSSSTSVYEMPIDVSGLSAGYYFLRLTSDKSSFNGKMIKQ